MKIGRRGFLGLLAGLAVVPRASWRDLWRPCDLTFRNFSLPVELAKARICAPLPEPSDRVIQFETIVIGQYADYYTEHDGMVETGPGCMDRMQARIDALPEGHPSKIELRPSA